MRQIIPHLLAGLPKIFQLRHGTERGIDELMDEFREGGVRALAKTISVVENGHPGFEDILSGQSVLYDDTTNTIAAKQSTAGGPMYIAAVDDHTVHVNTAATWLTSAAQTITYTGTVILIWKFLE